jgi:predicted TIM-barrel fold metal-dependent hydrolase
METPGEIEPYIVSVDDHVIEPLDTWKSRLPARLRDRGPRGYDGPEGVYWEFDGEVIESGVTGACVGIPLEKRSGRYHLEDIRPGCYDPIERVNDLDEDGVIASLCFPSLPGFGGTKFNCLRDRELGFACIQAYNDFQIDEWAGAAPGRLFAMILLPYWDTRLAVGELQRCKAKGAVAVAFSENPYRQGFPSIHNQDRYWDPVFAAAAEAEMPLCMHFGSSSWVIDTTSPDAPYLVHYVSTPLNSMSAMIDWLASGVFERYPRLQAVFSESYIGWIPFILEHADTAWLRHFAWTHDRANLPRKPSEYFQENVSVCLVYEGNGAQRITEIGADRVLAEADYPHADSQWPNTRKVLEDYLSHLSSEDRMKVLRNNANELFHLGLAPPE